MPNWSPNHDEDTAEYGVQTRQGSNSDQEERASWQVDQDRSRTSRDWLASPSAKASPFRSVKTLMSEGDLKNYHGLKTIKYDAEPCLVPIDADILEDERVSDAWWPAIGERIDALRMLAAEEGMPYSDASANGALAFARNLNATQKPSVFLVGNGNIRFLWVNGHEQIGLQFREGDTVQFVMFAQRGSRVATHMGDDDPLGVLRQITASRLRHLLGGR